MKQRDITFLQCINSVYEKFSFFGNNGNVSAYVYSENKIEHIPESDNGDIAFFIHKNGAFIFVDYGLIKPEFLAESLAWNEDLEFKQAHLDPYDTDEKKIGRWAGLKCFRVFAMRECRTDFDKEQEKFTILD